MGLSLGKRLTARVKTTAPVRLIVISFLVVITLGALLLCLPVSSRNFTFTHPIDALFVATSATCVTGLTPFDTFTHWNTFGQIVVLCLIQIGGLGLASITTGFAVLLRKKLGLRELLIASESANQDTLDVGRLLGIILRFTVVCEGIGAAILMIRFIPEYGLYGIWASVFTSISAFCNAGFDIFGIKTPDMSMAPYVSDPLVCLTVAGLIIVGGIGFMVVSDVYYSQLRPRLLRQSRRKISFHSQICLIFTAVLIVSGTVILFCSEFDCTMKGMPFFTRLNVSFFQSVSARTAGFASIDIASEHDFSKIITILLMFIGACPGSTGGGIKVTTFVVLACTVFSVFRGSEDATFLHRRITRETVYRALAIMLSAFTLIMIITGIILAINESLSGVDVLFEAVSAFATTGLSASVTPKLDYVSKALLSFLMFIGRVGPISFVLALNSRAGNHRSSILPEGRIIVG